MILASAFWGRIGIRCRLRLQDWLLLRGKYYWLFLLGANNSGTTVLERILQSHSLIRSLPSEGQLITDALPRPDRLGLVRIWSTRLDIFRWTDEDDPRPAWRAKRDWANSYPKRHGILLEKSPPNTVRSRWLQRNFRPSRFIAIVRNPFAVCEGIRRRTGCHIETAAQHWRTANECMFADMDHLRKCFWLRYEDFTERPNECLHSIQAFLNLSSPFELSSVHNVSAHGVTGEVRGLRNQNAESFNRLSSSDIRIINESAGPLMARLGYEMGERA